MKKGRPGFAIAAVFAATAGPVLLPLMRSVGVPDGVMGLVAGVLLGLAILLIALSLGARRARDGS